MSARPKYDHLVKLLLIGDSGVGKIFKTLAADVSSLLANQTAPAAPMISIVDD